MADENTPLLSYGDTDLSSDPHAQFCLLIGIPPHDKSAPRPPPSSSRTLYTRATRKRTTQNRTYNFTAALSNTLLLSQVVLGATLTALGASESSHVLITIFGVLNTIIAGLVAYLKSRGQPMRARMFRDDLEHVVDEIENSKTMWLGIRDHVHGYDEIDVDDKVSVRSEVARLTRLYESAVKKYMQNNPDMYNMGGGVLDAITGLRARPGPGAQLPPAVTADDSGAGAAAASAPAAVSAPAPEDESPATAKDHGAGKKDADEGGKGDEEGGKGAGEAAKDADESPITAKDAAKADDESKNEDDSKDDKDSKAKDDTKDDTKAEENGRDKGKEGDADVDTDQAVAGAGQHDPDVTAGASATEPAKEGDGDTHAAEGSKKGGAAEENRKDENGRKEDGKSTKPKSRLYI